VFFTKSGKSNLDTNDAAARARTAAKAAQAAAQNAATTARAAAASAQVAAQNAAQKSTVAAHKSAQKSTVAAQNASSTAQTTAAGVSKQVQQRVYGARRWAAPRLETVADYTTTTVAPTVSSALRNTAAQVRPAEPVSPARRRMASALTWSLLGAAILAAAGAVTALARYRRRTATNIESETPDGAFTQTAPDAASKPTGQTSAVSTPTAPKPTDPTARAGKASPSASANRTETVTDASVNGHANTNGW
jgi:hypothetical protein